MARVLLVEDDVPIADLITDHLARAGHDVVWVDDGKVALAQDAAHAADLILLDVMLPHLNGFQVCTAIRQRAGRQPVIVMLTARRDEQDALSGFEAGADDYIRKPFYCAELVRRVEALLSLAARSHASPSEPWPHTPSLGALPADRTRPRAPGECGHTAPGDSCALEVPAANLPEPRLCRSETCEALDSTATLHVSPQAQLVRVGQHPVHLTPKEFELLHYLLHHPGEVIAREALLAEVWRYRHAGYARTVDAHVMRIRKKLSRAGLLHNPIATVFGVGYRFEASAIVANLGPNP